jgi:branched-chain amino acid transport system permease protein
MSGIAVQHPPARQADLRRIGLIVLTLIVLALFPLVVSNRFYLHIGNMLLINVVMVVGFGVISRTGQLSLCHAAFMGLGAYTSALLSMRLALPPILTIFLGAAMCGIVAYALGSVILRLRGVYFVLVTFLIGQIFHLLLLDFTGLTRGANGLVGIPPIAVLGLRFTSQAMFFWFALAAATVVVAFVTLLLRSPTGRAFSSIEENMTLAGASGVNTALYQTAAFALGSAIAGLGGGLYAHYMRFISPDTFTFWVSVSFVVMVVVGGRGAMIGWLLGAAFITPLPEVLRGAQEFQQILYGVVLIVVLIFLPGGLITLRRRLAAAATRASAGRR